MPRVSKAKLAILHQIWGTGVLGAKDGKPYWVRGSGSVKAADVKALVAAGLLVMLNPKNHAMSTGQRFAVTEQGLALLFPKEPEGDDDSE